MTMTEAPTNRTYVGRFQHEVATCDGEKSTHEFTVNIESCDVASQICPRLFLDMEGVGIIGDVGTNNELVLLNPLAPNWTPKTRAALKKKTVEAWSYSHAGDAYKSAFGSRYGTV